MLLEQIHSLSHGTTGLLVILGLLTISASSAHDNVVVVFSTVCVMSRIKTLLTSGLSNAEITYLNTSYGTYTQHQNPNITVIV